jgi:hypothetical protein
VWTGGVEVCMSMCGTSADDETAQRPTLRLLREMSVLDVYMRRMLHNHWGRSKARCAVHLESAAELMAISLPRDIADSSTNDDELTIPRANARSASWEFTRYTLLKRTRTRRGKPALGVDPQRRPPARTGGITLRTFKTSTRQYL